MPPVVILSCRVLQSLMEPYLRQVPLPATFLDYGLHRTPQLMAPALQEALDGLDEPSLVIVGYGLCGNGLVGLKAGRHTLVVPRADDCIMMFLGSYQRYIEEFTAEPGTIYLTKGWLESGSHPLKEYREYVEQYDQETAEWLVDEQYKNYKRIVLVAPSQEELDAYRDQAREVAEFCARRWGFRYEEILGSDGFIMRLMTEAHWLPESNEDYLVIPPGSEVRQDMFFR